MQGPRKFVEDWRRSHRDPKTGRRCRTLLQLSVFRPVSMRRVLLHSTFGAALFLLSAPAAQALGFGRSMVSTTLGQPLDFSAPLENDDSEALARRCLSAEVRVGDAMLASEHVRATIENGPHVGERRIRVTTQTAINEPVVTVDLTIGCTSQMSRQFVEFVDPPMMRLASTQQRELASQRVDSQAAPLVDIVTAAGDDGNRGHAGRTAAAGSTSARPSRHERAPGQRPTGTSALERGAPRMRVAATSRRSRNGSSLAGAATTGRRGPRLQLDTAPIVLPRSSATAAANVTTGSGQRAGPMAPEASPASAEAASAALAAQVARIEGLEAALAQLRAESQSQQEALAALRVRLHEAEHERHANALVYLLATGLVFFAVLAAVFWARLPRQRRSAHWLAASERQRQREAAARDAHEAVGQATASDEWRSPKVSQPPSGWNKGPSIVAVAAPASIGGLEVTTVLEPRSHYARLSREEARANAAGNDSHMDLYLPLDDAQTNPLRRDAGGDAVDFAATEWPELFDEPHASQRPKNERAD